MLKHETFFFAADELGICSLSRAFEPKACLLYVLPRRVSFAVKMEARGIKGYDADSWHNRPGM